MKQADLNDCVGICASVDYRLVTGYWISTSNVPSILFFLFWLNCFLISIWQLKSITLRVSARYSTKGYILIVNFSWELREFLHAIPYIVVEILNWVNFMFSLRINSARFKIVAISAYSLFVENFIFTLI